MSTTKDTFIVHLRKARAQHLKWLNHIKLMVSGIAVSKEAVALNQSESSFGIWLYDEAMVFGTSSSKNVLEEIAALHTECYEHYLKIYHTLFANRGGGFFKSVFGNKVGENDLLLAQQQYERLVRVSDALVNRLRLFESQMLATTASKFDEMVLSADEPVGVIDLLREPELRSGVQRMYRGQPVD